MNALEEWRAEIAQIKKEQEAMKKKIREAGIILEDEDGYRY